MNEALRRGLKQLNRTTAVVLGHCRIGSVDNMCRALGQFGVHNVQATGCAPKRATT